MSVFYRILIAAVVIVVGAIFLRFLVGGNAVALFSPQGPVALGQLGTLLRIFFIMLGVAIPMLAAFFFFAWKYRSGNTAAAHDPEFSSRDGVEILLWVVPVAVVAILAVINWRSAHALDPFRPIGDSGGSGATLTVQVVALPWKWLFIYPQQNVATVNFLEFPERTPLHFKLTADGPMSSFWIPQLGSQIYAMAGMQTDLNLMADTTGGFAGKDTEINGTGYSGMTFMAKSVSQNDFDAWVMDVKQATGTLDAAAYQALAAPSADVPFAYYSSVSADLFDGVIMKFMVPGGAAGQSGMPMHK